MMYSDMSHHFMENLTYARHVERNKKIYIPCQAVCNMLEVSELPKEFRNIRRLERVLIARQLLFKRITIIAKGQSPKLKCIM